MALRQGDAHLALPTIRAEQLLESQLDAGGALGLQEWVSAHVGVAGHVPVGGAGVGRQVFQTWRPVGAARVQPQGAQGIDIPDQRGGR